MKLFMGRKKRDQASGKSEMIEVVRVRERTHFGEW